jgi:hypothetical protein
MLDQVFDTYRKAWESSMQMQQDYFKQWTQQWPTLPLNAAGVSAEWAQTSQKRWKEFTTDALKRSRETFDSLSKAGVRSVEDAFHLAEAKSPEEFRGMIEELWKKNFDCIKELFETQMREFQKAAENGFQMLTKTKA